MPYYKATSFLPLKKFIFHYSYRLKVCIFTESKLFYNTRSSAASRCFGKYVILEIKEPLSFLENVLYERYHQRNV